MKKLFPFIVVLLLIAFPLSSASSVSEMEISGYLNKESTRYVALSVTAANGSDVGSGQDLALSSSIISDDTYREIFSWSYVGTWYPSSEVKVAISPLKGVASSGASVALPFKFEIKPVYTFLGSSYLGTSGAKINNVTYTDTLSISVSGGTSESSIDASGNVITGAFTSHTEVSADLVTTIGYRLNRSSSLQWNRSGSFAMRIGSDDYSRAKVGEYRSTVTFTISTSN